MDEGYDGLGTSRHTLRSMQANEKQGINGPKVNGRIDPLQQLLTQGTTPAIRGGDLR